MAFVILLLLTGVVCIAPLMPAFIEWRSRRDALPLGIEQGEYTSVRVFAERFRNHLQREMTGEHAGLAGSAYLHVPDGARVELSAGERTSQRLQRRLLSEGLLRLPNGYSFEREVYGRGDVYSGRGTRMRAVLADARLQLEQDSVVLRWADAHEIHVEPRARLLGRASASNNIELAAGSEFRRVHAPRIQFGRASALPLVPTTALAAEAATENKDATAPAAPDDGDGNHLVLRAMRKVVKAAIDTGARVRQHFGAPPDQQRWLLNKNLTVPAEHEVTSALVVRGKLSVGAKALLKRGIKAYKNIVIEDGAVIEGAVVSRRDVLIGANCIVRGPVVAQGRVSCGAGSVIGSTLQPTTVTARVVAMSSGVVAHGTVWGRDRGIVL